MDPGRKGAAEPILASNKGAENVVQAQRAGGAPESTESTESGAGTGDLELLEGLAQPPSSVLPILTLGWWAWQCGREGEAVPPWFAPS